MTSQHPKPARSNLSAMLFHFQFDDLRQAYRSSMGAFNTAEENAEATVRKQYGFNPNEPFPEPEYDPDPETGGSTMDWGELVGELAHEAASSRSLVRTAFVIALFHFWERETNSWRGVRGKTYDHNAAVVWISGHGGSPEDQLLRDLELAANCAKHGPGRSCSDLLTRRPDLFDLGGLNGLPKVEPELVFTEAVLEEFFEAVRASGPKLRSPFV